MHRFFLNPEDEITNKTIILKNEELIHQLSKVLRFNLNDKIILINQLEQTDLTVEITAINKKEIQTKILKTNKPNNQPNIHLNLHFAILKNPDKNELILQKCTELGVTEFTPIITERTEKQFLPKADRLNRIIKEACEQSGRTEIPTLNEIKKFKDCLNSTQLNLIANPHSTQKLSQLNTQKDQTINLFIGPEGGFSETEIEQTKINNFQNFQLGKLILRAETACIVASGQILI